MFTPHANRETKDLLVCLFGGTFFVVAFQAANITTWFTRSLLHANGGLRLADCKNRGNLSSWLLAASPLFCGM